MTSKGIEEISHTYEANLYGQRCTMSLVDGEIECCWDDWPPDAEFFNAMTIGHRRAWWAQYVAERREFMQQVANIMGAAVVIADQTATGEIIPTVIEPAKPEESRLD